MKKERAGRESGTKIKCPKRPRANRWKNYTALETPGVTQSIGTQQGAGPYRAQWIV